MSNAEGIESLPHIARQAWKRLESELPEWKAHLHVRDGELEFAVPAPVRSMAGHLIAFTCESQLWVRFGPPKMSYPVDDEGELISLIRQLTADHVLFRVVTKDGNWVETTLVRREDNRESIPGHSVQLTSWSGKCDAYY